MTYAHPEYLISPAELAEDPGSRRILDVTVLFAPSPEGGFSVESGLARFNEGHIPRALFLDLIEDASDTTADIGFCLPPVTQLERLMSRLGISNGTEVVLYSSDHIMWATRAWWLLRYCGVQRARVLNGGLAAWRDAGYPLSTDAASPREGNFRAMPNPALIARKQQVLKAIGDDSVRTVNALPAELHSGEADFGLGRKGHIAKSVNLPYDDLLDDGQFKDAAALREALNAKGLLTSASVIAYCALGITATIDAFACLLCGQENVALYDGSLTEWAMDESLPMATGP